MTAVYSSFKCWITWNWRGWWNLSATFHKKPMPSLWFWYRLNSFLHNLIFIYFFFFYHQWLVCCVWWRGGGGAWESVCERDEGVFTVVPALLRMSPAIVVLMQHLPAVNKRQCHDSFASNHWSSAPNSSGSPALSYFKSLVPSQVSSMKMRNLLFGVILSLFAVVHSTPLTSKWTSFYVYNIHIFFFLS